MKDFTSYQVMSSDKGEYLIVNNHGCQKGELILHGGVIVRVRDISWDEVWLEEATVEDKLDEAHS